MWTRQNGVHKLTLCNHVVLSTSLFCCVCLNAVLCLLYVVLCLLYVVLCLQLIEWME